jgi:hypothetical protein
MMRLAILACLMILAGAGCSYLGLERKANPAAEQPPAGGEASALYYDFDDIAIPAGFKLVKDSSYVSQSGLQKCGLLVFDGRVEPVSATNFFVAAMARDNWSLKSSFKYGRTLMLFEKPGKTALISIAEGITKTRLEVWVASAPEGPLPASSTLVN